VTNDTGNDSFNYVDLGINGSNYNQPGYSIVGASDAYLYASHGNLAIGTASTKDIVFHAGGTTTSDKKMSINSTAVAIDFSSALVANGSKGTAGHILHSSGTGVYWAVDDQGVTSVASGNGITGGTIVNTGTLYVTQGTGVVVNTSGVHVNAAYISTISANSATYLGNSINSGNGSGIYTTGLVNATTVNATTIQVGTNFVATASQVTAADLLVTGNLIVNGTTVTLNTATLDVKDLNITLAKGTASAAAASGAGITVDGAAATLTYINAGNTWLSNINFSVGNTVSNVSVNSTAFIGNVVGNTSGVHTGNVAATTISGNLTGNVAAVTITGNLTGNVIATTVNATTINATANIVVGANVLITTANLAIGNSTANVYVNSTAFVGNVVATTVSGNLSGTAANATLLNNKSESNLNVNNATYAYGKTEGNLNVNNALLVRVVDSRAVVTTPETVTNPGLKADFKQNSTEGLSDGGSYFGELTFRPYGTNSDWSGGPSHQLGFTSNNNIFFRSGNSTTWGSWKKIVDANTNTTFAGMITFSANVGIGNTSPAHNLRVTGTTSLAGAVSDITTLAAGNTTITGFANVSGNLTVGTLSGGDRQIEIKSAGATRGIITTDAVNGIVSFGATNDSTTGIITLKTGSALSERVRIDESGNVGIGNTSPAHKLRVTGTTSLAGAVSDITTLAAGNTTITGFANVFGGTIEFDPGTGTDETRAFNFNIGGFNYGKILVPSGSGGAMALWTGTAGAAAERMRIAANGNVGIGNTAPAHKLRVTGTTSLAGAVSDITTLAAGNTTITGFINSTSTVTAVDFNSTSDVRYKSDIVKIEGALDKLNSLSGYTFTMNETGERSTGLIAQEVEKVLPEAVKGEDKKTLSYGNMIGLLVEAIKEQGRKIEVLESELNKLREQ
jgi:hypothetical protein